MGIPLKRGRDFSSGDLSSSQFVAVISESLAQAKLRATQIPWANRFNADSILTNG